MPQYDLMVVGGGTAGLVASAGAAGIGARVALVEQARLGGECLWTGCVPSKALIACARALHDARSAARFGVEAGEARVDLKRVLAWIREAQQRIEPHDSPERFRELGVDVVHGTARFSAERTLTVDHRTIAAKRILIATGSSPAVPSIQGLTGVPFLTNESLFDVEQLPETLLVLGAGAIGLEMAQAFARLGARVRVIEAMPQLLPREDHELAELLAARLAADGIEILLGTRVTRASRAGARIVLDAERGDGTSIRMEGDALLVATGRVPNIAALELARGSVAAGTDGIVVDARLKTTAGGVWAAGDVTGGPRFTHVADYQARLVVRNAFFPFGARANYDIVPWVTFTEPPLAHVGLTERQARERYGDAVRVWRRPFADVDRAIVDGETAGMLKLVSDRRGKLLGGHVLGHGAGNLIAEITLAMQHGIGAGKLGNTMHAYPTYAEAVKQAAEQYTRSRFTGVLPPVARWFARR